MLFSHNQLGAWHKLTKRTDYLLNTRIFSRCGLCVIFVLGSSLLSVAGWL